MGVRLRLILQTLGRWLHPLRWYLWSLIPFIVFSGLSVWHLKKLLAGQYADVYSVISLDMLIEFSPKLFWIGVIFSGTLLVLIAINDLFDAIGRRWK